MTKKFILGVPDVIDHTITKDDEFFVLACDGKKQLHLYTVF